MKLLERAQALHLKYQEEQKANVDREGVRYVAVEVQGGYVQALIDLIPICCGKDPRIDAAINSKITAMENKSSTG